MSFNLTELINNPYVVSLLGVIGITGVCSLVKVIYNSTHPMTFLEKIILPLMNMSGKKIYSYLAKIEDEELRKQVAKDLDDLGDKLDEAWDAGLKGEDYVLEVAVKTNIKVVKAKSIKKSKVSKK